MSRAVVIAKLKRQEAEIDEIVAELKEEGISHRMINLIAKIKQDANTLIEALQDKSVIPRDHEELDISPEIRKLEKKVGRTKERIKKMKDLSKEKEKLEGDIEKELEDE